jgi:hypothetical protein
MPTFSFTLVQKIEAHSEQIADQVVDAIVRDPGLREMQALHRDELSRRARDFLGNLGHWLVARDQEVAKWSESLGRTRFEESIPLCELIRGVQIVKEKLIDFARAGMAGTALQIYAEGELEYQVGRFFDAVVKFPNGCAELRKGILRTRGLGECHGGAEYKHEERTTAGSPRSAAENASALIDDTRLPNRRFGRTFLRSGKT